MELTMERDEITHGTPQHFEIVEDNPFFAPVATDVLDSLIGQYQAARQRIDELAKIVRGDIYAGIVGYFISGNAGDESLHRSLYVDKLFEVSGAVGALNSAYWSKALALTDVYQCMPQERKNQWNTQLRNPAGVQKRHSTYDRREAVEAGRELPEWESEPLPDFEEGTVRATIEALLLARSQFLAERVDGIFRALSGEHVTNAPEAFGKRMIVAHILNSYGTTDHDRIGYLHDLRKVIAKFMGRDEPGHQGTTDAAVTHARHKRGEWIVIDGGALKLRVYKVGTAHLEVHPDMAWRLNQILAFLHPTAIPAQFRQRPKRKPKDVALLRKPLPFEVLHLIAGMKETLEKNPDDWRRDGYRRVPKTRQFDYGDHDKHTLAEARAVIESIGGIPDSTTKHSTFWRFDYEPADVLAEIVTSGCVPDTSSHQFYPTPENVAAAAVELAEIGPDHVCLEPQAGHGDLAQHMPKERTRCVEIAPLRCSVLKARGFNVEQGDFIEWATGAPQFDRIVCNPPFSEGRWKHHTETAAKLVRPGGRLVAILPASARNGFTLPGMACRWSETFHNEFAGTSVSVAILIADRGEEA